MTSSNHRRKAVAAISAVLLWQCVLPVQSQDPGNFRVCKQGEAEDWAEPDVLRRDIVVPRGAIFQDVGPVKGPVPMDEWWKLRIETLAAGTIRAQEKCITVPAKISAWDEDWGRLRESNPTVTRVQPADGRLFEILTFAFPFERKLMAPWADVVPVDATVVSPMRR